MYKKKIKIIIAYLLTTKTIAVEIDLIIIPSSKKRASFEAFTKSKLIAY